MISRPSLSELLLRATRVLLAVTAVSTSVHSAARSQRAPSVGSDTAASEMDAVPLDTPAMVHLPTPVKETVSSVASPAPPGALNAAPRAMVSSALPELAVSAPPSAAGLKDLRLDPARARAPALALRPLAL